MEYLKINSLWKREGWEFNKDNLGIGKNNGKNLIPGEYADPTFEAIKRWRVDEKIDGTNIRIIFNQELDSEPTVIFGGRTDNAQLPPHLLLHLQRTFTIQTLQEAFLLEKSKQKVILFGEGYGPKIQSGGYYRSDASFILFDIWVNGWWLKREDVKAIAQKLSITTVPEIGIMQEEEIIEFVKSKPLSRIAHQAHVMEGVVCRSDPLLLHRNGKPVMWKLKCKDFE
jgi:ATP-dependent RNA circularization protein (DNA/RNA ligase family)